jgi:hypothetical protein
MARDEQVTYRCDVCGRKTMAQQIRPANGQPYYVRPIGWGAMSGVIQINGDDRVKEKWDFCSEECARKRFEEMLDDAYQA